MADARRSGSNKDTQPAAVPTDEHGIVTTWSPEKAEPQPRDLNALLFDQMSSAVAVAEIIFGKSGAPTDYRVVSVNPAFERLTGRTAAEIVGTHARSIRPGLRQELIERLGRVSVSGQSEDFEGRDVESDRSVLIRLSRLGPTLLMAMVEDVTDARRAQAALMDRTAFIETIIASAGEGIIVYDRDLHYVAWNPMMEELTGLPAGQVLGGTAGDLFPEVMATGVGEDLQKTLADEATTSREFEYVIPGTGRRGWVVQTNRPHQNAAGKIVGVVSSVLDVTARHLMDEAQRRSEEQFRTIFDNVGDAVAIYEPSGDFVEVNRVLCERLGYSRDELLSMSVLDIDAPESASLLQGRVERIFNEGLALFEVAHVRRDGTRIPTEIVSRKIEFRGRPAILTVQRDITSRKQTEEALRVSEQQFRTIFDSVGDGVAILDPDGNFLEVNLVICERLGYSREELLAMPVAAVTAPEWIAGIPERVARLMRDGVSFIETVHLARDGKRIPTEILSRRIQFHGRPAILSVLRDITERKAAENALSEQARFMQEILNALPIPIIAKEIDGCILLCNEAFAAAGGRTREEIVGKMVSELGILEPEMHEARDGVVLDDGTVQVYEAFMPAARGGLRRHVISKAPVRAKDGTVSGMVTAAVDIHDRYEAEQALKSSEERFRTLFEHAGDAIFISGIDGHFVDVNQTACDRLGYTKAELVGLSLAAISPPELVPSIGERLATIQETGSLAFETVHLRRDGTAVPVEMIATMLTLEGKPAVLGISRDVSERKGAEAERAALEDQLRQAQKMEGIGKLAGGIAHDFNNLLTAIRGNASLALLSLPPGEGPRQDLEQIEEAADRAAGLTRQLLAFARRTVLQPEVVDLREIVRRLEPMLHRLIGEDVSLVTVVSGDACCVLADPGQLEQVIVNLAVNARDAMPDGGKLTIEVAYGEVDEGAAPMATMAVTDTGTGMAAETLDHIFEPFFTTKGPGKGTGLGLSTAYGIVKQSGGTVTAQSEPGRGSTLTVILPRVDQPPRDLPQEVGRTNMAGRKTGTILVVEDDRGVRRFVSRVLEAAGYVVRAASDGSAAIAAAASEPVQLLVTDVVMPGMGGREVALKLAASQPGIRVLYMSGHTDKGIVLDGVLEPDIQFLAKPFTAEALLAAVDKAMSQVSDG